MNRKPPPITPLPARFMGKITISTQALSNSAVSIKIEVASRFEQSNQLYQQMGFQSHFSRGVGVWTQSAPQKFEALKAISAFWRLNLRTKEHVFHSRKCSVQCYLSVTQSIIPTRNEQIMKTKLRTFAHKPIKNLGKK